jgi:hypothetical protein
MLRSLLSGEWRRLSELLRTHCGRLTIWPEIDGERAGAGRARRGIEMEGGTPIPGLQRGPEVKRSSLAAAATSRGRPDEERVSSE